MFIALYMFFFFIILYLKNRKELFEYPIAKKKYSISVLTPAYNEEESVEGTINAVLGSNYPIKEMIIINDCSNDQTPEIVRRLMKKYKNLRLINNSSNLGKAGSLNRGIKEARGELIAIIDSDSYPDKDSIKKMVGFFDYSNTGAVTCAILVREKNTFIRKLQSFEYSIIAWTRKLLSYVDGVYATPGPLSIYRRKFLLDVKGFDTNNLTEDIEITWRVVYNGYKAHMCLPAKVYSIAPSKISIWFKQRMRWNIGGLQCINKYKKFFLKKGMLGFFILPFFTLSLCIGLVGLGVFAYTFIRSILQIFFFAEYTSIAGTQLLYMQDLYVTPTVLNFFGIVLFLLGLFFTFVGLGIIGDTKGGIKNIFNVLFYIIVYLTLYPFIMFFSIIKVIKHKILGKKLGWGTK